MHEAGQRGRWEVIRYYELQWLEEEYHKAFKTSYNNESWQRKTAGRLEKLVGRSGIVAVQLLQLRSLARSNPDLPTRRVVPGIWLAMLKLARIKLTRVHDQTVVNFYREVALLGDFLGRKHDGRPTGSQSGEPGKH